MSGGGEHLVLLLAGSAAARGCEGGNEGEEVGVKEGVGRLTAVQFVLARAHRR